MGLTFQLGTEVRGGLVTFFAMAYIIVLNPLILGSGTDGTGQFLGGGTDGPNLTMIAAATALIAGVMTILMGLVANFPYGSLHGWLILVFVVGLAPVVEMVPFEAATPALASSRSLPSSLPRAKCGLSTH